MSKALEAAGCFGDGRAGQFGVFVGVDHGEVVLTTGEGLFALDFRATREIPSRWCRRDIRRSGCRDRYCRAPAIEPPGRRAMNQARVRLVSAVAV
ncbi:hypothetical protein GCM10010365_57670 [Streptomyces poonensis]|uniref:Uncharacterized protein n=1 Tax=Streptomyces poonensis TaxID=68255 RepID=A0A918Q3T0_9ACTN|nr:hypothetical protein GCM10010365_57670 [Streptomyces poonensis]